MEYDFEKYYSSSHFEPEVHYWDLPDTTIVGFEKLPKGVLPRGKNISIKKLKHQVGNDTKIEHLIDFISSRNGAKMKIKFPIRLNNIYYARLYALMKSEGSFRTEFSVNVPELFFHKIFSDSLILILGNDVKNFLRKDKNKGVLRTRANDLIRHLIPFPEIIPDFILDNKEFCREYLKIAFEAEGSPILSGNKRYISLKRNYNVSHIFGNKVTGKFGERIYIRKLSENFPKELDEVIKNPDPLILGEHLILKKHFGINNKIAPECIRINQTEVRRGFISVRTDLFIYADNVKKFINEIDFISRQKRGKTHKMLKFKSQRERYFSLELMKRISKDGIFTNKDFISEMKKLGYTNPCTYIWKYKKKGLIKKLSEGNYSVIYQQS